MQASVEVEAGAGSEQDRRVAFLGEAWAACGRTRDALRGLLRADITVLRSGPDLLGMAVASASRRHYIFLNHLLPRRAPIVERIVLAPEAVHIIRGIKSVACCHPKLALALRPEEFEVWVQTGFMLVPHRYSDLWLQGWTPADILARYKDNTVTERMIEWRGLMEIAQGNAKGDSIQARARADAMLREGLTTLAAAAEMIHDEEPNGYSPKIVALASRLIRGGMAALVGLSLTSQSADLVQFAA
jgi:hypothetical protein